MNQTTTLGALARAIQDAQDETPEVQEQRVQALLDQLVHEGHLTPEQAGEAYYEEASAEFDAFVDIIHSYSYRLAANKICRVYFTGDVERFDTVSEE